MMLVKGSVGSGRKLLALLAVVGFADFIFGATFVSQMLAAGVGPAVASLAVSIAGLVSVVVEVPSGVLGDKYGHKRLTVSGLLAWGLGLVAFGVSTSTWMFVCSLLLWGIGMSLFSGAPGALVVNELRANGREDVIPRLVARIHIAHWVASAAGACSVFLFGERVSAPGLVVVAGVVLVVLCVWVCLTWVNGVKTSGLRITETFSLAIKYSWRKARLPLVYGVLLGMLQGILVLSWQPLILEVGSGRASTLGLALFFLSLAAALGSWFAERLVRVGRNLVTFGSLLLLASGLILAAGGGLGAYAGIGIAELGIGLGLAVVSMWQHEVFEDSVRNTQLSLASASGAIGMAAAQAVFGLNWERWGLGPSLVSACVMVSLLGLLAQGIAVMTRLRTRAEGGA